MLTREAVLEAIKARPAHTGAFLDGRDRRRLLDFFPRSDWHALGFEPPDNEAPSPLAEWSEPAVLARLAADLDFAFEKALNKRGISAELMYHVIVMWLWILEDPLAEKFREPTDETYPMYGLPLLKAVAMKYGLPNPIGDDTGREPRYASEGEAPPPVTDIEVRQARRLGDLARARGSAYLWIRVLEDGRALNLTPWSIGGVQLGIGERTSCEYQDQWQFDAEHTEAGWIAVLGWDGKGEPEGWTRHPGTGRRRPDGTKKTEHIQW